MCTGPHRQPGPVRWQVRQETLHGTTTQSPERTRVSLRADLLDHAPGLVPEDVAGVEEGGEHLVQVQVRTTQAGRGDDLHDRIGPILQDGSGERVDADVTLPVPGQDLHDISFLGRERRARCRFGRRANATASGRPWRPPRRRGFSRGRAEPGLLPRRAPVAPRHALVGAPSNAEGQACAATQSGRRTGLPCGRCARQRAGGTGRTVAGPGRWLELPDLPVFCGERGPLPHCPMGFCERGGRRGRRSS